MIKGVKKKFPLYIYTTKCKISLQSQFLVLKTP